MTIPKGKLIAIGGNEDKGTYPNPTSKKKYYLDFFELGILKRIITELQVPNPRIEVITSASMIPEEVGDRYIGAFSILGCTNIGLMHIRTPEDALLPEYLERLRATNGILFTGGDQSRLVNIFGQSQFLQVCQERYLQEPTFVIAGTSAGAMAMSEIMIKGGSSTEALMKGAVKLREGLGLIRNVIIDSHFVKRGRFGRLIEAVSTHPKAIGIGLGEDTGVLITNGNQIETIGSNLVIIIDGHHINHNNTSQVPKGTALSIENLIMHVLAKGNLYDIIERTFYRDKETHLKREDIAY
ncbi:cyanophycinase [Adhaeribacter rhizoryzae]|uniref:Cyanophycinase n=1 Tax=Adhaeribacter rhizoryzae TaxID=2607907 RepID=A0A5M6DNZ6_9BACT|nr:cyanophycinase [Adhaeribacter rhizoryzae]KAA5547969.1 cyanophycinase [Adhaeribacter rhizoryzae]